MRSGPTILRSRFVLSLGLLNVLAVAVAAAGYALGGSFNDVFLVMLLVEVAVSFVFAGLEDIRNTPSFIAIARAFFKRTVPYSLQRHKEAQKSANNLIFIGIGLFAESMAISLLINVLAP